MNRYQLSLRRESRARRMLIEFSVCGLSGFFISPLLITGLIYAWYYGSRIDSFFTWVASEVVKFFVL
jgi:hypothetical protein